jgi:hypothetical protein
MFTRILAISAFSLVMASGAFAEGMKLASDMSDPNAHEAIGTWTTLRKSSPAVDRTTTGSITPDHRNCRDMPGPQNVESLADSHTTQSRNCD